ncbi:MAG: RraA family protein [Betaproteobacteria bacterium]
MSSNRALNDPLLEQFLATSTASLSDAIDAVVGIRGAMNGGMRQIVSGFLVGRAATALLRPAARDVATREAALQDSIGMIDESLPGEVGVIVLEDGLDAAGLGGLMAVAAHARGMAGLVCDGAVRDVAELRDIGLPVFARAVNPAACVGRHLSVGRQIPVTCAGVLVRPGDIVVGDDDGMVVVPQEHAEAVLRYALDIDEREARMVSLIREHRGLRVVAEKFNRG